MKKAAIILFISLCLGQTGYFGSISFDYSGSDSGSFYAELSDSSFGGSFAVKTSNNNGTTIFISAIQPLDSVSFSVLFIYLQSADTNLTSNVWTLPPDDIMNPDVVFGFFPVIDSSLFNQFIDFIPDTFDLDSIILDSTFFEDLFTEILIIISGDAYIGILGSINLNPISTDSIVGQFNVSAIQPVIPPGTINISNGTIQLAAMVMPQVGIEDEPEIPEKIKLVPAYPNPFNPVTTIRFSVVETLHATSLHIFDITGRLVETLISGEQLPTGNHSITWNATQQPSGVYFVRLISGSFIQTQKLILMK
ncbi:MAG: T9SS type A sorting domain-containing protein [Candidatus Marinimicrobia bacterium]|nr:T9SS type A sorting domain-containing protein [Candidatus Neomarinimicrobiota bacterium]